MSKRTKAGVFGNCSECGVKLGVYDEHGMCVDCRVEANKKSKVYYLPVPPIMQTTTDEEFKQDDPLAAQSIWRIAMTRVSLWIRKTFNLRS